MNLTREEAIRNHRKMWYWIAEMLKSGRYKALLDTNGYEGLRMLYRVIIFLKHIYIHMIGIEYIAASCFCCEYASSCNDCPIKWGETDIVTCSRPESPYRKLLEMRILKSKPENIDRAAELAYEIANLPEKEF